LNDDYHYPYSLVSLPVLPKAATAQNSKDQMTSNPADLPEQVAPQSGATAETAAPPPAPASAGTPDNPTSFVHQKLIEGKVIEALRQVYDPEIPVNIYELGLIYEIKVEPDDSVQVKMTLTAPACPVAGTLPGEVERTVEAIPEVKSAKVELVWEPPWSRDLMSEAALLQLGMF
jgi:FeS assembly SUF system protein